MPRFIFRLEPVLGHRQRREDEQQLRLAAVLARLFDAQNRRDATIAHRDELHEQIRREHRAMNGDDLRATYAHCAYLERRIAAEQGIIDRINIEAQTERAKLLHAVREKKVIATLKERRREVFEAETTAAEQRESDEINARRFDRRTTTGGTSR